MTSMAERTETAKRFFDTSRSYLSEPEDGALIDLSVVYEEILGEDEVNYGGIHLPSLEKAFGRVEGSREAWDKWHEIMNSLRLSGNFDY